MEAKFKLIQINNEKNKQNVITKQRIHVIYSWGHIRKIPVVGRRKESYQNEQRKNRNRSSQYLNTFTGNMIVHAR